MSNQIRPEVRLLRKNVYDFLNNEILKTETKPPVLEIGPMQLRWTPVTEYFVDSRFFFKEHSIEYLSCDTDPGSGCEIISSVLELEKHLKPECVGTIIALEVLEHVPEIWKIPQIFYNLLKKGGSLFISVPYYFYRHSPFPDYWRISEDGLRLLFGSSFEIKKLEPLITEDERKPLHYTLVCVKK